MNENTKRQPRRSQEQWQAIIESHATSGLSAKTYCEQNAVGYASFCKWKQRLSSDVDSVRIKSLKPQAGFIDLSGLPGSGSSSWQIVLKLGDGMELHLTRS